MTGNYAMFAKYKQSFISVLEQLKWNPEKAKKPILGLLRQDDIVIPESRKGIDQIYQGLAVIFTYFPKMRIEENKAKILKFSDKLEKDAPMERPNIGSRPENS